MKNIITCSLLIFIMTNLFNCSESTKSQIESQTAIVFINQYEENSYLLFDYAIYSDPITNVNSIEVNNYDLKIDNYRSSDNLYGYSPIYEDSLNKQIDKLKITIKTELGELKGTIEKPDTVSNVTIPKSIQYGDDIEVSWSGNADYYNIYYVFRYIDENGRSKYYSDVFTYLTKKSLTISNDIFNYDGIIDYLQISPVNGPIPKNNSNGNMSGDGGGFIYYTTYDYILNNPIIVGDGYPENNYQMKAIDTKEIDKLFKDNLFLKLNK